MFEIQMTDAKAQFSTLVDKAIAGEAALITKHGKAEVVLVSFAEWQKLQPKPNFGQHLLNCPLELDDILPPANNDFSRIEF